jgi:glycosyltransferase involved in cell wall biosynthesis
MQTIKVEKKKRKFIKKDKINFPLISIITVSLNSEKHIEQTIKSVLDQSYKNIEYIIIDGGSSDQTVKIIKKYNNKIDYWVSQKDTGLWNAMNKGINLCNGSVIGIINSDDYYYKNAIQVVADYFNKYPEIDFLFGSVKKYKLMHGFTPWKVKWSFGFYTSHSVGFFIRSNSQRNLNKYNEKYYSADLDLFYRAIVKFKMKGMSTKKNEIMGVFRKGGISSRLNYIEHLKDLNRIRIDNSQNIIFVYIIFLYKIIKNFKKIITSIIKNNLNTYVK